jgi:hypothetical protein
VTDSVHREPTNEALWAQPPIDASATYPGQQLAPMTPPAPMPVPASAHVELSRPDRTQFVLAIVSLGCAIPLSGIGAGVLGLPGLLITWIGIVLVNFFYAWSRRPH